MKLTMGKRILMFFHWLLSLLICVTLTIYVIRPGIVTGLYSRVAGGWTPTQATVVGIALLAIYVILTVIQAYLIFQRGKRGDRGFITVDSSDSGRVRIAVSAIEQMVRQSVINIDGISDMKIDIESQDDAISIVITAILQNGCHVPTVTMNMQQAIRKFVEINCGVAVRSVSINIDAVSNAPEGKRRGRKAFAEPPMPAYAPPEPEPDTEPEPVMEAEPVEEPEPVVEPEPVEPEPAFDLPERGPIKLTLDYDGPLADDTEAPGTEADEA